MVDLRLMVMAGTPDLAEALHWVRQLVGATNKKYKKLVEASGIVETGRYR